MLAMVVRGIQTTAFGKFGYYITNLGYQTKPLFSYRTATSFRLAVPDCS